MTQQCEQWINPAISFTIRKPDDLHLHVRDNELTPLVLAHTSRQFARATIMPNLVEPVATTDQARVYRQRILERLPDGVSFEPLMTLYLTQETTPQEIRKAKSSGFVHGVKLYPAHATTNSAFGVSDIDQLSSVFETMQEVGMLLLLHGEVVEAGIDVFDREKYFIERRSTWFVREFPELRMVQEHITTKEAVDFVRSAGPNVAATITPHHLLYNRNAMLADGLNPHLYCKPILKQEQDRKALIDAAMSGNPKFFCGTDSAPHPRSAKECACGCAGVYSAYSAVEWYASIFDEHAGLDRPETQRLFEAFMSEYGARFYGLPLNKERITLSRKPLEIPERFTYSDSRFEGAISGELISLGAGQTLPWTTWAG